MSLHRTERAEHDLIDIWLFIAKENPQAADQTLINIDDACQRLLDFPLSGPIRDDIAEGFRHLTVGNYLILYRVLDDGIEIVRCLHGARNLKSL